MYTNKPLYGSNEEIALIREKAKETGKDVEAETARILGPGYIFTTLKPIAQLIQEAKKQIRKDAFTNQ